MARVAINGFGRIGRATFKLVADSPDLELVALNDLVPPDNLAYLLQYDTVYGRYPQKVEHGKESLSVNGKDYRIVSEKDPALLPWKDLGAEIIFECTGVLNKRADLEKHLRAGAKYVILSAPTKSEDAIVSSDIIKQSYASIIDLALTQVVDGDLLKVMSWYDNEWGYASQMVREAQRVARAEFSPETVFRKGSGDFIA